MNSLTPLVKSPGSMFWILHGPGGVAGLALAGIDFSSFWMYLVVGGFFMLLNGRTVYKILLGVSVVLPFYYYSLRSEDKIIFKWFSIVLLLLPAYAVIAVGYLSIF